MVSVKDTETLDKIFVKSGRTIKKYLTPYKLGCVYEMPKCFQYLTYSLFKLNAFYTSGPWPACYQLIYACM